MKTPDATTRCSYCRSNTHSDVQCNSTRPAGWRADQAVAAKYVAPPVSDEHLAQRTADALAAAGWTVVIDMRRGPESCVIQRGAKTSP